MCKGGIGWESRKESCMQNVEAWVASGYVRGYISSLQVHEVS